MRSSIATQVSLQYVIHGSVSMRNMPADEPHARPNEASRSRGAVAADAGVGGGGQVCLGHHERAAAGAERQRSDASTPMAYRKPRATSAASLPRPTTDNQPGHGAGSHAGSTGHYLPHHVGGHRLGDLHRRQRESSITPITSAVPGFYRPRDPSTLSVTARTPARRGCSAR